MSEVFCCAVELAAEELTTLVFYGHLLVQIEHVVVQPESQLGIVAMGDEDGVALYLCHHFSAAFHLVLWYFQPIEGGAKYLLLLPDDAGRVGSAAVHYSNKASSGRPV